MDNFYICVILLYCLDVLSTVNDRYLNALSAARTSTSSIDTVTTRFVEHNPLFVTATPTSTLQQLMTKRSVDRCFWRVFVQLTYVKSIMVTMRCKRCLIIVLKTFDRYPDHHEGSASECSSFNCPRCKAVHASQFFVLWEGVFAVDDGSAECDLQLEGDAVLHMLDSTSNSAARFGYYNSSNEHKDQIGATCSVSRGSNSYRVQQCQQAVEQYVRRTGKFEFSTAEYNNSFNTANLDTMENDINDNNNNNNNKLDNSSQTVTTLLGECVKYCTYSKTLDVTCKISYAFESNNSTNPAVATSVSTMKLQDVNHDKLYSVSYSYVPIKQYRKLLLLGYAVEELVGSSLISHCWELLAHLKSH